MLQCPHNHIIPATSSQLCPTHPLVCWLPFNHRQPFPGALPTQCQHLKAGSVTPLPALLCSTRRQRSSGAGPPALRLRANKQGQMPASQCTRQLHPTLLPFLGTGAGPEALHSGAGTGAWASVGGGAGPGAHLRQ